VIADGSSGEDDAAAGPDIYSDHRVNLNGGTVIAGEEVYSSSTDGIPVALEVKISEQPRISRDPGPTVDRRDLPGSSGHFDMQLIPSTPDALRLNSTEIF
jgi:hypothetical protein